MDVRTKYLARYTEPRVLSYTTDQVYRAALVVPAYDEPMAALRNLAQHAHKANALLIVIVNTPSNAPKDARARTIAMLNQLEEADLANVLALNYAEEGLPRQKGVGLARKIGCDTALSLQAKGQIESPWIYTTDADAYLPDNYFSYDLDAHGAAGNHNGARVFAHRHKINDAKLQQAVDTYDLHMAYYVAGLTFAGSRYAHPTLGSTIAIHGETYAQVRGFPKKNAAEDFYLLNKVAKIAPVTFVPEVELILEGRLSERVPFGTGPALAKITALDSPFESYNFAAFEALHTTLSALTHFGEHGILALSSPESMILDQLGWSEREQHFADRYAPKQRQKAVHDWFDALKTLQFMHKAAEFYPDENLLETMRALPKSVLGTIDRHMQRDRLHK